MRLSVWVQKRARIGEFWVSFEGSLRAVLRERKRRILVIKGELARVKAKLRKSRLGEFLLVV